MTDGSRLAGVELGGTKSIAVLGRGSMIVDRVTVPTTTPEETLGALARQLADWAENMPIKGLGIASFGPLQLSSAEDDFGRLLPTPKAGWAGARVAETLTGAIECPWGIDTDVNAAALAEYHWGAGQGCDNVCYITIGTGVGGGLVIDGKAVHGAMHPEIGHLRLRRVTGDAFPGACPFHGDCIEGLISGPALKKRLGGDPASVPDADPRWRAVASDLAELACAILLVTSAQRILIGGGVGLARPFLLPMVRRALLERAGGYLPFLNSASAAEIIRLPALGDDAGPLGAIALAHEVAEMLR